MPAAARVYEEQLMEEINKDRKAHEKKPFDGSCGGGSPKEKEITVSTAGPESGMFHKGEHKRCFAYEAHTVCEKHSFAPDAAVTSGNVHDSAEVDALYDKVTERFPEIKTVAMDAGYKTPWISKKVTDDGSVPQLPEDRGPPYLAVLFGRGGGYPAFTGGKRELCPAFPNDRAGFRGRIREI